MQIEFFHHRLQMCMPVSLDAQTQFFFLRFRAKLRDVLVEVALQFVSLWSLSKCSYFMYVLEQIISEHLKNDLGLV